MDFSIRIDWLTFLILAMAYFSEFSSVVILISMSVKSSLILYIKATSNNYNVILIMPIVYYIYNVV